MRKNNEVINEFQPEDIMIEIDNFKETIDRYQKLRGFYEGEEFEKIINIEGKGGWADNKAMANHPKIIIDTRASYVTANPIKLTADNSERLQDYLDDVFMNNNMQARLNKVLVDMDIYGVAYIMAYQNDEGITRVRNINPTEVIVYKNRLTGTIEQVIRPFIYEKYNYETKQMDEVLYAEVYRDDNIKVYMEGDDSLELVDEYTNIYGRVPFVEFTLGVDDYDNADKTGLMAQLSNLAAHYNDQLSDMLNENKNIGNSYLTFKDVVLPGMKNTNGVNNPDKIREIQSDNKRKIDKITKSKVISYSSLPNRDGKVDILEKGGRYEPFIVSLKTLRELMYTIAQVPDTGLDENFAGNTSGESFKYKFAGLDAYFSEASRSIEVGLRRLIRILSPVIKVKAGHEVDQKDITITLIPNKPKHEVPIKDIVELYKIGIISKRTALMNLTFIDDPDAVIEEINREEQMEMDNIGLNLDGYTNEHELGDDLDEI